MLRVLTDEEFLDWCGSHKVTGCGGTRQMEGADREVSVCEDCRANAQFKQDMEGIIELLEDQIKRWHEVDRDITFTEAEVALNRIRLYLKQLVELKKEVE